MDTEYLHNTVVEMHNLLDDLTRFLKRRKLSTLAPLELAGHKRRMERLRELCDELEKAPKGSESSLADAPQRGSNVSLGWKAQPVSFDF